jgi:hypothetical protein
LINFSEIVREDKKKQKEARETERKQRSSETAFAASGKNTHGLDADLLRKVRSTYQSEMSAFICTLLLVLYSYLIATWRTRMGN